MIGFQQERNQTGNHILINVGDDSTRMRHIEQSSTISDRRINDPARNEERRTTLPTDEVNRERTERPESQDMTVRWSGLPISIPVRLAHLKSRV